MPLPKPWSPSEYYKLTASNYRARRRQRRFIGNGLGEKANDRIVARRQKRKGMQWSVETTDALAALRTLLLNDGWDTYWQQRRPFYLETA